MTSLTSQKEPLDSAQLFVNLREVSRVLAHEVDRLTDELPKSEKQVRSAAEGIALARGDIQALAQHAKMLNDTWRRSEELAESVGKAAAKASVKAIEETVEELTDQLKNSVIEATKAARDLDRAMHINKAFWKIALMLVNARAELTHLAG